MEADAISASTKVRVGKLNGIIFPPADFTDQPSAWRFFVQGEVAATGARIAVHNLYCRSQKGVFCDPSCLAL